jgi:toxin ParE1/3/4
MAVIKAPQAERDLDEIAAFLQGRSGPRLAVRFLRAAEATFRLLATSPGIGQRHRSKVPGMKGVRNFGVVGFSKYRVLYQPTDEGIEVLRVVHAARDLDALFGE